MSERVGMGRMFSFFNRLTIKARIALVSVAFVIGICIIGAV